MTARDNAKLAPYLVNTYPEILEITCMKEVK
jgi:D-alanyl-D-alanine carboxypeptidase